MIKEITDYINTLTCSGGGDIPEDIVGALKHALKMNTNKKGEYTQNTTPKNNKKVVIKSCSTLNFAKENNINEKLNSIQQLFEGKLDGFMEKINEKFNI